MDIEAVLSSAEVDASASDVVVADKDSQPKAETVVESGSGANSGDEDISKKADSELTHEQLEKRESNRRSREKNKMIKLRREIRELRELTKTLIPQNQQNNTSGHSPKSPPTPPVEENFNTWDELRAAERQYYRDLANYEKANERPAVKDVVPNRVEAALDERKLADIATREAELIKALPDVRRALSENAEFLNNMPKHVAEALANAEDPTLAFYALERDGVLEDLEDMTPLQVAYAVGRAELRGASYLPKVNKVTNAPKPMDAARGRGSHAKALGDKSVEELMKIYN